MKIHERLVRLIQKFLEVVKREADFKSTPHPHTQRFGILADGPCHNVQIFPTAESNSKESTMIS
jgi:hypothetical protein